MVVSGNGLSGKSPANRSMYVDAAGRFLGGMMAVSEQLTQEMGLYDSKRPCPFFHVNQSCKHDAAACRFYH